MASLGSFAISPPAVSDNVTTPTITNETLLLAATEYPVALPANTKIFKVLTRSGGRVQLSYTLGQSGTTYVTIYPGSFSAVSGIEAASITLYLQSPQAGTVVEIESWV